MKENTGGVEAIAGQKQWTSGIEGADGGGSFVFHSRGVIQVNFSDHIFERVEKVYALIYSDFGFYSKPQS